MSKSDEDAIDCFTGRVLCCQPDCQWETPTGLSGIEARYRDALGKPVCFEHRPKAQTVPARVLVPR